MFPPFFLTTIGFVIFPYFIYLINKHETKQYGYIFHFLLGLFYGIGFLSIYLGWIDEPFLLDENTKKYSYISYLLIFYCSIFFGLSFCIIKYFKSFFSKWIVVPLLFVFIEILINNISYGFPWISFSLIHSANIFGKSLIYYFGTYGISYITIVIFLIPSIFLINLKNYKKGFFLILIAFIIFLSILVVLRISNFEKYSSKKISLSMIQLNYTINQNLDQGGLRAKYQVIDDIIKKQSEEIIIFGENNFPYTIDNPFYIETLNNNLKPNQSFIIGATSFKNGKYYNSLIYSDKDIHKTFDKKILVPFGEFIPFRSLFGFLEFIAGTNDFSKGENKRILEINNEIKILPVICYEILYFWQLLDKDNDQSNVIVNITNDYWFGSFSGPYQHFYFNLLRASELNKPIIRVSNNGISASIDNYGRIIDYIDLNKNEIKKTEIKISKYNQNYIQFHKYFILIFILLFIFAIFFNKKFNE